MIRQIASRNTQWRTRGGRWTSWLAVVLAALALALALGTQFSIGRDAGIPDARIGFVCAALILAGSVILRRRAPAGRSLELSQVWEWRIAIVLVGLALLFRIHQFYRFPPGLWFDEAVNGVDAIAIMEHGNHLAVWRTTNNGHSTLYFYLLIASFKLFGFTLFAMRIVPVVAGVAAVAAFYVLARRLLGVVAAMGATALMAVSRYAVTFSRISWEASLEPLLEIMAVYFFVRALDTRRKSDWFMAGASLAAGLYTYAAFRMVPLVMAFLVAYVALTGPRFFWRSIPGLIFYLASFLVVVAPLGQFVFRHSDQVTTRQREVSVFKEVDATGSYAPLRNNITSVIRMMNVRGDPNARHNLPDEPMLDGISAALLVLGMGVAAWSVRDWRRGGLLGWYALALVPSAITITSENPSAIRTIGVIPPMFLLVGLAIDALYRTFSIDRWRQGVFLVILLALCTGATAANYHVLFDRQAKDPRVYDMFLSSTTGALQTVARESGESQVYLNDSFLGPASDLLTHHRHPFESVQPAFNVPVPSAVTRDALFVLDDKEQAIERYLLDLYPTATSERITKRFGDINYTSYITVRVPAEAIRELHRAHAEYTTAQGGWFSVTDEGQLAHTWPQDLPPGLALPFTFSWSGVVTLNPVTTARAGPSLPFAGLQQLIFTSPGPVRLEIDGLGAREGRDSVVMDVPADLPAGLYRYHATATVEAPGATKLEWQLDDGRGATRQVVSTDALVSKAATQNGFLARYFRSTDWSGPVIMRSLEAYPYPVARLFPKFSAILDGSLDVKEAGLYGFAVNAEWPLVIQVDGRTVVDASAALGWRRVEGTFEAGAGAHTITIKYVDVGRITFDIEWRSPGAEWRVLSGEDVKHPKEDAAGAIR